MRQQEMTETVVVDDVVKLRTHLHITLVTDRRTRACIGPLLAKQTHKTVPTLLLQSYDRAQCAKGLYAAVEQHQQQDY